MPTLLRPRWIVTHLIVIALAVTFVSLGLWQLRRLDERRADNTTIAANMSGEAQPLATVLERYGQDPQGLKYRPVTATGIYRPADEVLLTPRSNGRLPGHHVVTPLMLDDGRAVLVDRGWVPFDDDTPPVADAAPPTGTVTVEGILLPTQTAVRSGTAAAGAEPGGRLTFLSTVDVDLIQPQVDVALHPVSILLQEQDPAPGAIPIPGPRPEISEGSHQSYAGQWFAFTAILLGGYPLLLRRSLRARADQPQAQ